MEIQTLSYTQLLIDVGLMAEQFDMMEFKKKFKYKNKTNNIFF